MTSDLTATKLPLIGLTAGEVTDQTRPDAITVYGQGYTYVDALVGSGAPLIIPLTHETQVLRRIYELLDGVLLAGGNDLCPQLYHQPAYPETNDYSQLRDQVEVQLLEWALQDNKPVLGICRGMHLINVYFEGSLHQHLPTDLPAGQDHGLSTTLQDIEHIAHRLRIKPGSQLHTIVKTNTIGANTHHHQAIAKLGKELEAVAWAEDGVIEVIESPAYAFVLGVQSHPESLIWKAEPRWKNLFAAFVAATQTAKLSLTP